MRWEGWRLRLLGCREEKDRGSMRSWYRDCTQCHYLGKVKKGIEWDVATVARSQLSLQRKQCKDTLFGCQHRSQRFRVDSRTRARRFLASAGISQISK